LRAGYRIGHHCQLTADLFSLLDRRASDFDCYYAAHAEEAA
jgi:hypothetical protein